VCTGHHSSECSTSQRPFFSLISFLSVVYDTAIVLVCVVSVLVGRGWIAENAICVSSGSTVGLSISEASVGFDMMHRGRCKLLSRGMSPLATFKFIFSFFDQLMICVFFFLCLLLYFGLVARGLSLIVNSERSVVSWGDTSAVIRNLMQLCNAVASLISDTFNFLFGFLAGRYWSGAEISATDLPSLHFLDVSLPNSGPCWIVKPPPSRCVQLQEFITPEPVHHRQYSRATWACCTPSSWSTASSHLSLLEAWTPGCSSHGPY
jgi:hypothetical protein